MSCQNKWLIALALLVGVPGAYFARADLGASYAAEGNLWIEVPSGQTWNGLGPIEAGGVRQSNAWVELLRSYRVLDAVVVDRRLYLHPPEEHTTGFADFDLAGQYVPGVYELRVGATGEDYDLVTGSGDLVQRDRFAMPIGRNVGFEWTPSEGAFEPGATVEFSVKSVREAARDLSTTLTTALDRDGNFLRVRLEGTDPHRVADDLNALMERFVDVAAGLKRSKLDETLAVLEEQLQVVELELAQAERDLEEFRVGTTGASSDLSPRLAATRQSSEEAIEERRLIRRVETTANLHFELRRRVETARLTAASSTPDIRVLDYAVVPQRHGVDPRLPLAAAILFSFLGAALVARSRWAAASPRPATLD